MTLGFRSVVTALLPLALLSIVFAQEQTEPKEFVAEGVVVAYLKSNRYPIMGPVRGVAHFAEFWIVRIDKREDGSQALTQKKYFRVEYNIYERGLTDREINGAKLRLKLRERRENENTNCYGSQRELSNYVRTTPGQQDSIPPLDSLPCLIADQPPVVVPE